MTTRNRLKDARGRNRTEREHTLSSLTLKPKERLKHNHAV